jgi:hypothetical protein
MCSVQINQVIIRLREGEREKPAAYRKRFISPRKLFGQAAHRYIVIEVIPRATAGAVGHHLAVIVAARIYRISKCNIQHSTVNTLAVKNSASHPRRTIYYFARSTYIFFIFDSFVFIIFN